MAENDSIYELQYNWQYPVRALRFLIPKDSLQLFNSFLGGDIMIIKTASILDSTVTTPIGRYDNCYSYQFSTVDFTKIEIVSPGIGIIEKQYISHGFAGSKKFRKIAKLKSYLVKIKPKN